MPDLKKELKDKLQEAKDEYAAFLEQVHWHNAQLDELSTKLSKLNIYINNLEGVIKNGNF